MWSGQSLPQWTAWAKALNSSSSNGEDVVTEAATLAINFSDETLPAGTITIATDKIFGVTTSTTVATATATTFKSERDVWTGKVRQHEHNAAQLVWEVPELAPHSSYFATLTSR